MKIAVLGGGFTGLSSAYDLLSAGHSVAIYEKENVLGGLAAGFREQGWEWSLERAYHHLFANDRDIIDFAAETGFADIFFRSPLTASLYSVGNKQEHLDSSFLILNSKYLVAPLDTPLDFLRFPLLSWPQKARSAAVLAFLKFSPYLSLYEKQTAAEFLKKTQGDMPWHILWEQLFRKKFGKYAENILAAFIWARITKRTKNLGYVRGGFQALVEHIAAKVEGKGGRILRGTAIEGISASGGKFAVGIPGRPAAYFDAIICTLPTPVTVKVAGKLLPEAYLKKLQSIKFLHAVNMILETSSPILDKTYWLSNCVPELPYMVLVQHTNFVEPENYGGSHLLYAANYVADDDPLLKMPDDEIYRHYSRAITAIIPAQLPQINRLRPSKTKGRSGNSKNHRIFKAGFAQPIFDREFPKNKPDFVTPLKNFYIANLDMTFPYDRGTNYAVKLGREAARLINKE